MRIKNLVEKFEKLIESEDNIDEIKRLFKVSYNFKNFRF